MNVIANRGLKSINWSSVIMLVLGFWLSASLMLDFVILPSLSAAGMMNGADFASAGYLIFSSFNRVELVAAALVLTGFLAIRRNNFIPNSQLKIESRSLVLAVVLLAIALIYTYFLTPQMSGLMMQFNWFETTNGMPDGMFPLQGLYWGLEAIKLVVGAILLGWSYQNSCSLKA